ncbi:MAG: hypothetical protein ICV53_03615 [Flavisolibacter sp.]|nr:hypothetical protein [Flavisolibacter sp.]MBD0365172.1 hypothetical protein [Flavisolibacter sp.]
MGHSGSDDYLWGLLNQHGCSKKAPRPEHPKAEAAKEKTEAFKKSTRTFPLHNQRCKTIKSVF